jgi:hypothetical protein
MVMVKKYNKRMRDASEKRISEREDLVARYTLFKARVAILRQRREIEDMKRELAGGEPAYNVVVDSVAPARKHKRLVFNAVELPSAIYRKLVIPPIYAGVTAQAEHPGFASDHTLLSHIILKPTAAYCCLLLPIFWISI